MATSDQKFSGNKNETGPVRYPTFRLIAFRKEDDTTEDTRAGIPIWRIGYAAKWAALRGNDTILIEPDGVTQGNAQVIHHLCQDPACPGGC